MYKVIRTRDVIFDGNSFYDPKGQNINYLLRDILKDTIQTINLLEPLYEDKLEDKLILYIVDFTPKGSTLNFDQMTTPESNDSAEYFIKDIKQLLTSSRMVSPNLLELSTTLEGL